ncbi:hypothetical protein [Mycobacterium sp. 050134]|uniref:hypothetical protein n=1 Tax=Mycobacterium sp. 050134 TaxID=3096111 RepID=UPI002ED8A64F
MLNSVVRYFPSVAYLSDIGDRAIELLLDGGRLFLGDIRDLRSADMCRLMVARCSSPAGTAEGDICAAAAKLAEMERELLVYPDFFVGLLHSSRWCRRLTSG